MEKRYQQRARQFIGRLMSVSLVRDEAGAPIRFRIRRSRTSAAEADQRAADDLELQRRADRLATA